MASIRRHWRFSSESIRPTRSFCVEWTCTQLACRKNFWWRIWRRWPPSWYHCSSQASVSRNPGLSSLTIRTWPTRRNRKRCISLRRLVFCRAIRWRRCYWRARSWPRYVLQEFYIVRVDLLEQLLSSRQRVRLRQWHICMRRTTLRRTDSKPSKH